MFTDEEHRIILSAMGREMEVCKKVDAEFTREPYEVSLESICKSINKKIYDMQHKYRLHDLREDPDDLPQNGKKVIIYLRNRISGTHYDCAKYDYYLHDGFQWSNGFGYFTNVIAWREIEELEEVEEW